jgi:hypothetical protein
VARPALTAGAFVGPGAACYGPPVHRLLYLAYGREDIRTQALYAAMTALAHRGELALSVHVLTDDPGAFAPLAGRVALHAATPADVADWMGPERFALRAKPAALRDFVRRFGSDAVLLADADTFFVADVGRAFERIAPGAAVLWEREYPVRTSDTALMHRFRRHLRRARFRAAPIDLAVDMWNSGAVGLHPAQFALVDEWLAFVDEVYPATRRWILEQFAISWVLQKAGVALSPCEDLLHHYWFEKPAHLAAVRAALEHACAVPLDDALAAIRSRPIDLPRTRTYGKKANFFQRTFGW